MLPITVNVAGQVGQIILGKNKALWPLFETVVNSIQSLEDTPISEKQIVIDAIRTEEVQLTTDGKEELSHFHKFVVTDNGNGFNTENYSSFLEAFSQLKIKKGCKGIGRFIWLKAFDSVAIKSTYCENGKWYNREFSFTLKGVEPEDNLKELEDNHIFKNETKVTLIGFKSMYRDVVAYSLTSLAEKIIEHCLPYFVTGACPHILLRDNTGDKIELNNYYNKIYKDYLNQDVVTLRNQKYVLYHMLLSKGVTKHELHLCANNREVKSIQLSEHIPNLQKKLDMQEGSCYYVGYLTGDYLDSAVNAERSEFNFLEGTLIGDIGEEEIINAAVTYIKLYLQEDLVKIEEEKKKQIDSLVNSEKPQYRVLLNKCPEIYDKIPAGLAANKIDMELYKCQQQWEYNTKKKKEEIDEKLKNDATTDIAFEELFEEYCQNITELSRASLAEYVVKRKAVIELLEKALSIDDSGKYSKESRVHSIICPMQVSSNEINYDDMNLWLIDDRLAYHHYLASDKKMKKIPLLESTKDKRMDIAVFDAALSYTADPDNINSITIVELKKPQRNDLDKKDNDPVRQVINYVQDIKNGKIKKTNGRDFGDMSHVAFYCYIIGDLTESMHESAIGAGLNVTQDKQGYFGYNPAIGAYIEIISYDKLLKDAKQRNRVLFDKLFEAKADELIHPEFLSK